MSDRRGEPDLRIERRREGDAVVLRTVGEVTVFTSPQVRQALSEAADERPGRIVVDLAETPYIDSSGVATLLEGLQRASAAGGKLVLAGLAERVRGVFEIARLENVFTIAADVEEALEA